MPPYRDPPYRDPLAPPWADDLADFANRITEKAYQRLLQIRVTGPVQRTYHIMTAIGMVEVIEEVK